jgi:LysM repeat protein
VEADLGRRLLDTATRSPDPAVCPFLRSVVGEELGEPLAWPDDANRCLAGGTPVPQDLEWQAAKCLVATHVTCSRYLADTTTVQRAVRRRPATSKRASAGQGPVPAEEPASERIEVLPGRPSRTLTPAILLSLAVLVTAASAAITFVAASGGLQLPTAPPAAIVATASPAPTPGPTSKATPEVSAPSATPTATSTTTPSPSPVATRTPAPTPFSTPQATSSRYALLTACPSKPDCYLYTVRSGDNLFSIANYFGVPYDTVLQLNPGIGDPATIQPGTVLTLPPPTR